jgi:hypothetical protein
MMGFATPYVTPPRVRRRKAITVSRFGALGCVLVRHQGTVHASSVTRAEQVVSAGVKATIW